MAPKNKYSMLVYSQLVGVSVTVVCFLVIFDTETKSFYGTRGNRYGRLQYSVLIIILTLTLALKQTRYL